jgi:hypothetical protein
VGTWEDAPTSMLVEMQRRQIADHRAQLARQALALNGVVVTDPLTYTWKNKPVGWKEQERAAAETFAQAYAQAEERKRIESEPLFTHRCGECGARWFFEMAVCPCCKAGAWWTRRASWPVRWWRGLMRALRQ